ncbi:MAG: tripartite tricarboxylate transporter TctB family protein [Deltaproteobacteria bacterium]|nr:tripartite tricarboxylate transporter TctB family protein [Deltaproteobacteria bacterium]
MISGLVLLMACALLAFWVIPAYVESGPTALMPYLSVLWMAFFSTWLVYSGLRHRRHVRSGGEEAALIDRVDLGAGESLKVILLILIWGIHIFLLSFFGYYLGGFLALTASMVLLGKRSYKGMILWSVGALLAMYILFEKGLQLRLPKGVLIETLFAAVF